MNGLFHCQKEIKFMEEYNELLELIKDDSQNQVWLRNRIYLWEKEGKITYLQREELLGKLDGRR